MNTKGLFLICVLWLMALGRVNAAVTDTLRIDDGMFESPVRLNGVRMSVTKKSPIKLIVEMVIKDNRLFIVYEQPDGMGQTFLESYAIDTVKHRLVYESDYGKRASGSYLIENPTLCLTENKTLCVADAFFGNIYNISTNGKLDITDDNILDSKICTVPYPITKTASNVFRVSEHKYYFLGHQPKEGAAVLFRASASRDSLDISEIFKPINREKYKSWVANYGHFAYSHDCNVGVYAYHMYPAVEFFGMDGDKKRVVVFKGKDFDPKTLRMGDTWDLNPTYNVTLSQSHNGIYSLYWGKKFSTMKMEVAKKRAKSLMIRYDWSGKPQKIYSADKMLMRMAVSDANDFIIAYDGKYFWYMSIPQ